MYMQARKGGKNFNLWIPSLLTVQNPNREAGYTKVFLSGLHLIFMHFSKKEPKSKRKT